MINIPVSVGELIDKLSILQVKKNNITNDNKLKFVRKEFDLLYELSVEYLNDNNINKLYNKLIDINSKLWVIEDELRLIETTKNFDEEFISLSRRVYHTNDERFELKNNINKLTKSNIVEIKDYKKYK